MGRPREFDTDKALRAALLVFWEKGFDGSSLTELAGRMGIVRPSLQAAFGNKADLYRAVIDLYGREAMQFIGRAVREPTATAVANSYLSGFCAMLLARGTPSGCFLIKSIMAAGEGGSIALTESASRQRTHELLLAERFRQAQADGDLDPAVDPGSLAERLTTFANGLAVRADLGASAAELRRLCDVASFVPSV